MRFIDTLAMALGIAGLGATTMSEALPHKFPNAPGIFWDALFYVGLALVVSAVVLLVVAHLPWRRLLGQREAVTRKPTRERFYEAVVALDNRWWRSLNIVANEARGQNDDTPFGQSLADLPIAGQIAAYAGKINDVSTVYGTVHGLSSEIIKLKGARVIFHVNGGQMDSTDEHGRPLYRYIHMKTRDVGKTLATVRAFALAYLAPPEQ